jgi:hypothetical protein
MMLGLFKSLRGLIKNPDDQHSFRETFVEQLAVGEKKPEEEGMRVYHFCCIRIIPNLSFFDGTLATNIDFTCPDAYATIKKEIGKKLEQGEQVAFTILTLTLLTD